MNDTVLEVAKWIVYNIEDLSLRYVDSATVLPFEVFIMNNAALHFKDKYTSMDIEEVFEDNRIQVIIDFYQEERDESTDSLH